MPAVPKLRNEPPCEKKSFLLSVHGISIYNACVVLDIH